MRAVHTPVLHSEVIEYLNLQPGRHYIDATADGGGHAIAILERIQPGGKLLAVEWDGELAKKLDERLQETCSGSSKNYTICRGSFSELEHCARSSQFSHVFGVLFDFGLSSFHLEVSKRGFSFQRDEPLDMRFDSESGETAAALLARLTAHELEDILQRFGGERFSRQISGEIVRRRKERPIRTTKELVDIVHRAIPRRYHHGRLHFATRTFQALRIAVNQEFENISQGLAAAARIVALNGRILVISYHSGEDSIVKHFFRQESMRAHFAPVVKKPIRPSASECAANPRARSARLRVFEKIA